MWTTTRTAVLIAAPVGRQPELSIDLMATWVPSQAAHGPHSERILDTVRGILIGLRRCRSDMAFDELHSAAKRQWVPAFALAWALAHFAGGGEPASRFMDTHPQCGRGVSAGTAATTASTSCGNRAHLSADWKDGAHPVRRVGDDGVSARWLATTPRTTGFATSRARLSTDARTRTRRNVAPHHVRRGRLRAANRSATARRGPPIALRAGRRRCVASGEVGGESAGTCETTPRSPASTCPPTPICCRCAGRPTGTRRAPARPANCAWIADTSRVTSALAEETIFAPARLEVHIVLRLLRERSSAIEAAEVRRWLPRILERLESTVTRAASAARPGIGAPRAASPTAMAAAAAAAAARGRPRRTPRPRWPGQNRRFPRATRRSPVPEESPRGCSG